MKLYCCLWILILGTQVLALENVASNVTVTSGSNTLPLNASLLFISEALAKTVEPQDIIVKEGNCASIECKLNVSRYESIHWYNSKGYLLKRGGKRYLLE